MPRGDNPNSRANLKRLSTEEARKRGAKGGRASAKRRKAYASLTEALKDQCTPEVMQKLTAMLIEEAEGGNMRAYELLRDQMGEKPVERVEQTNIEISVEFEDEANDQS